MQNTATREVKKGEESPILLNPFEPVLGIRNMGIKIGYLLGLLITSPAGNRIWGFWLASEGLGSVLFTFCFLLIHATVFFFL